MSARGNAASAAQRVAAAGLEIRASRSVRMVRLRASCLTASERRHDDAADRCARSVGLADRRRRRSALDFVDRLHTLDISHRDSRE